MPKFFLKLICAYHALSLGFCILSTAKTPNGVSKWSPMPNGDEISMVQVHAHTGATIARQPPKIPKISNDRTDSFVKIGSVPVYGFNRVRLNPSKGMNTWMLMFPADFTQNMLLEACSNFPAPSKCLYTGHPEQEGMAFITIQSDLNLFTYFLHSSCNGQMHMTASVCVARYVELDAPMNLFNPANIGYPRNTKYPGVPWGLDRTDQRTGMDGNYKVSFTGNGIHIFHFDTGIRANLSDFGGRAIPTLDWSDGVPIVCDSSDTSCATDMEGHGTHTAGTIASYTYGIAKKAIVHSIKVLDDFGNGSISWFVNAMDWVISYVFSQNYGTAIISASLGGRVTSHVIPEMIEKATFKGIVVVVAAGNEAIDACSTLPAGVKSAITVGSYGLTDKQSTFSNVGKCVDIFAPGNNISSLSLKNGYHTDKSGTSMACPHVAGVVALLLEGHPNLKPTEVQDMLKETSTKGCLQLTASMPTSNRLLYFGTDTNSTPCQLPFW